MVGEISNHKMLCLGNLGEWFGETGRLMGDWGKIDKGLTEIRVNHRVNQWVMMMHKTIFKNGFWWKILVNFNGKNW